MDSFKLLVVLFAIVSIGYAISIDRYARRRRDANDEMQKGPRPVEPPEERGNGYEGDMVPTDNKKKVLDDAGDGDNDLDELREKRKGLNNRVKRRFRRYLDEGSLVQNGPRPVEPPEERGKDGYQGDMVVTEEQKQILDGDDDDNDNDQGNPMDKRKGLSNLAKRWPKGIVPYKIAGSATKYKKKITDAMAEWSQYTCLKFKPKSGKLSKKVGHKDYVDFHGVSNSEGCSSFVGYIANGAQRLNLTDDCTDFGIGTIIHEIGHAIGYVHEQSRPDRDNYVTIHLENVPLNKQNNFKKFTADEVTTNEIPYDHASIMHYGSRYGSGNDGTTIEVRKLEDRMDMGQRYGLSRLDIKHANLMYECAEVNECETLNSCANGGICVDEAGTFKCECPKGYRGLECEQECADDHDDCYFFAGSGDCVGGEYQGWMLTNCKKSCGICQPYECMDINVDDQCAWAKEQGFCETEYVDWMKQECQQTCGFCNYCNPAPCLNEGTCNQVGEGYSCTCPDGFVGENCETPL